MERHLRLQVDISLDTHRSFLHQHGIENCESVLDVGTGTGYFLSRLATFYPAIKFTGIDFKVDLIKRAETISEELGVENVSWIHDDINNMQLDNAKKQFDGILLRFSAVHIPKIDNTLKLLKAMLRPGGKIWIITMDLDHMYNQPKHKAFELYKEGTERLFRKLGMDCHIGAKLPKRLVAAGFNNVTQELDPMSNRDSDDIRSYQQFMLNEARLFNYYDSEAITQADLKIIGTFVENTVPRSDFYCTYGCVMIAAEG